MLISTKRQNNCLQILYECVFKRSVSMLKTWFKHVIINSVSMLSNMQILKQVSRMSI